MNTTNLQKTKYKCLVHLDRLSITFKHWSGSKFQDLRNPDTITCEQIFGSITLLHDSSPGVGAFYHTFKVLFKGYVVGKLHTATKLKKNELQFDFDKQVFYTFSSDFWYEIYTALSSELEIRFNNIHYVEISIDVNKNLVDAFAQYYTNCINNHLRSGDRYRMRKGTLVNVMANGTCFVISGSENSIGIYNKSDYAEQFILDYFTNNGLVGQEVYRIEARLSWNYIRHLRNRRSMGIDIETLLDEKKLAMIFMESTRNKIYFEDSAIKTNDKHRNAHFKKYSILDDLEIETAEIGKLNPCFTLNHYKTSNIDVNIMRQNYFRYLETGNPQYLNNFKSSGNLAGYSQGQMVDLISNFNKKFMGNRTRLIAERMTNADEFITPKSKWNLAAVLNALSLKLKTNLSGLLWF